MSEQKTVDQTNLERVKNALAGEFGVGITQISPKSCLEDLWRRGATSNKNFAPAACAVLAVEEEFGVDSLPEDADLTTVEDILDALESNGS